MKSWNLFWLYPLIMGIVLLFTNSCKKEGEPEIDPYAADLKILAESRKKVAGLADWIIPGHGKMFKNKQKIKINL